MTTALADATHTMGQTDAETRRLVTKSRLYKAPNAGRQPRMKVAGDPTYVMGRSEEEARRLEQQAELFTPTTRALFEEAGITTGMKVLDVGSGSGDVTLLAAEMVGATGHVVGVDVNPAIVATARARAQAAGLTQVSFMAGDLREVELERDFDAVVGRFVLMYQSDPIAALGRALRALRGDGVAVFYEANMDSGMALASLPVSPLHSMLGRCVTETFARGGVEMAMGTRLHQAFLAAGLEAPRMRSDALIGGRSEWVGRFASYAANVLRSMRPLILQYGVATEEEIAFETFERRYREEVLGQGSLVQWFTCVGAWARKRAAM
jgi:tRNA A58 N-methylase Trm61